jgi:hypothetical protein
MESKGAGKIFNYFESKNGAFVIVWIKNWFHCIESSTISRVDCNSKNFFKTNLKNLYILTYIPHLLCFFYTSHKIELLKEPSQKKMHKKRTYPILFAQGQENSSLIMHNVSRFFAQTGLINFPYLFFVGLPERFRRLPAILISFLLLVRNGLPNCLWLPTIVFGYLCESARSV